MAMTQARQNTAKNQKTSKMFYDRNAKSINAFTPGQKVLLKNLQPGKLDYRYPDKCTILRKLHNHEYLIERERDGYKRKVNLAHLKPFYSVTQESALTTAELETDIEPEKELQKTNKQDTELQVNKNSKLRDTQHEKETRPTPNVNILEFECINLTKLPVLTFDTETGYSSLAKHEQHCHSDHECAGVEERGYDTDSSCSSDGYAIRYAREASSTQQQIANERDIGLSQRPNSNSHVMPDTRNERITQQDLIDLPPQPQGALDLSSVNFQTRSQPNSTLHLNAELCTDKNQQKTTKKVLQTKSNLLPKRVPKPVTRFMDEHRYFY